MHEGVGIMAWLSLQQLMRAFETGESSWKGCRSERANARDEETVRDTARSAGTSERRIPELDINIAVIRRGMTRIETKSVYMRGRRQGRVGRHAAHAAGRCSLGWDVVHDIDSRSCYG